MGHGDVAMAGVVESTAAPIEGAEGEASRYGLVPGAGSRGSRLGRRG